MGSWRWSMERGPAGRRSVLKAKGFCENGAQAELLWGLRYKVQHTLGGTLERLPISVRNSTCSGPVRMVGNAALFGHQEGLFAALQVPGDSTYTENGHNEAESTGRSFTWEQN